MHGHHNIDFLIITQKPNLIHRAVIAQVSRHLHILPTWSGRKMLEWPEYVQNPSARSNRDIAVTTPYKVPKESFKLYHSAQGHTKLKQRKPWQLYVTLLLFLMLPVIFYYTYNSVFAKHYQEDAIETSTQDVETVSLVSAEPEFIEVVNDAEQSYESTIDIQLLTRQIDWSLVSSCVANDTQCVCYGYMAEKLVVPDTSCRLAANNGWPSDPIRQNLSL
jgi:zona occludens toxin